MEKFFFMHEVQCFTLLLARDRNFITRATCSCEESVYLPPTSQDANRVWKNRRLGVSSLPRRLTHACNAPRPGAVAGVANGFELMDGCRTSARAHARAVPLPRGGRASPRAFGDPRAVPNALAEDMPGRIRAMLGSRIGERRASMWFDGEARLRVHEGQLQVETRSEFVADWIKRNFRGELQAAAREALGTDTVHWCIESPSDTPRTDAVPAQPTRERGTSSVRPSLRRDGSNAWRRLDDFVPGPANQLALDAARRMAQAHDELRFLVVHGGCGVGKTHLLQGLCRARREHSPQARIRYVPAEQFTNEYIHAVRAGQVDGFRGRMRRVDLLVIDDVHFLADKAATQSEFLHTLDALDLAGAQVALASDEHPRLIRKFGQSLVSRMLAGMVVRVETPDQIGRAHV